MLLHLHFSCINGSTGYSELKIVTPKALLILLNRNDNRMVRLMTSQFNKVIGLSLTYVMVDKMKRFITSV